MSSSGISAVGLLGVVFVTLRLVGVIDWSWWWVTAPFWAPSAVVMSVAVCAALLSATRRSPGRVTRRR